MTTATQVEPLGRAEHWPCTPAEYHADDQCLSHSRLEDFIEDPALFEGRYITKRYPARESAAYEFGTLVHDALLQGGTSCVIVEIPADVLSSSGARSGSAWKQFAAEHAGKYLLKSHEIPPIREAVDAVWAHPKARAILDFKGGFNEYAIRWTDEETDIRCRALLDRFTPVFVGDLKTTVSTNKRQFAAQAYKCGYFRQAAMYLDAAHALTGNVLGFVFIAVRKDPPYSVETFIPDEDAIGLARTENREAMRAFAACCDSGVWKREGWGTLQPISCPKWAFFQEE